LAAARASGGAGQSAVLRRQANRFDETYFPVGIHEKPINLRQIGLTEVADADSLKNYADPPLLDTGSFLARESPRPFEPL
jgi:hypothetical protein